MEINRQSGIRFEINIKNEMNNTFSAQYMTKNMYYMMLYDYIIFCSYIANHFGLLFLYFINTSTLCKSLIKSTL